MVRLRSPAPAIYGGIPERPKGADCKSVVTDFAGPNPASPTITRNRPLWSVFCYVESRDGNSERCAAYRRYIAITRNKVIAVSCVMRSTRLRSVPNSTVYPQSPPRIAIPGFPIICSPFHTFPYPTLVVGFLLCREPGRQQRKL